MEAWACFSIWSGGLYACWASLFGSYEQVRTFYPVVVGEQSFSDAPSTLGNSPSRPPAAGSTVDCQVKDLRQKSLAKNKPASGGNFQAAAKPTHGGEGYGAHGYQPRVDFRWAYVPRPPKYLELDPLPNGGHKTLIRGTLGVLGMFGRNQPMVC